MTALLLGSFLALMAIGVPVALVMGIASLVLLLLGDVSLPLLILPQSLFRGIDTFPMMAVPLFILAADLMTAGRLTDALLKHANLLVGHFRGGLGYVNVLISMFFAGISGSALADAAGPSKIVMDMMRRSGYPAYYAGALSATTATIGPIIPPSIIMVIYAVTDNSVTVAGLFLAGVVPGVLLGVVLALTNYVLSVRGGYQSATHAPRFPEVARSFLPAVPGLLMPVIILGGILGGVFTATEAAAVAVFYALFVSMAITRKLGVRDLPGVLLRSGLLTSAVLLIVSMATIFSRLLTFLQIPQQLARWVTTLTDDRALVLILLSLFVLACGLVIDTLPAVIILVPVLAPIATQFGIDPLQFAMMIVLNLAIGMVTPPIGPVLFVISTVGNLRLERLARAVLPFLVAELVVLALVVAFPALTLTLPAWFGFTR
jgi:tripartite ATP-independent transporter DctM subunit